MTLPYAQKGRFVASDPAAHAYQFTLAQGQSLQVILSEGPWFAELYRASEAQGWQAVDRQAISAVGDGKVLQYLAPKQGDYRFMLQAPLTAELDYSLGLEVVSDLAFPVDGYDARDIQSFFGAPRDGGRVHKGVDVFAPRGTPLVAVADGVVTSTRSNRLGGKVVWLRSQGRTYYYAHLDQVEVSAGKRIQAGERLGTVGNTGNAKTTTPHLHFGIYQRGTAIDPLPYLQARRLTEQRWNKLADAPLPARVAVQTAGLNFRQGPSTRFDVIRQLAKNDVLRVDAISDNWLRVATATGETGFVSSRHVQPLAAAEPEQSQPVQPS